MFFCQNFSGRVLAAESLLILAILEVMANFQERLRQVELRQDKVELRQDKLELRQDNVERHMRSLEEDGFDQSRSQAMAMAALVILLSTYS